MARPLTQFTCGRDQFPSMCGCPKGGNNANIPHLPTHQITRNHNHTHTHTVKRTLPHRHTHTRSNYLSTSSLEAYSRQLVCLSDRRHAGYLFTTGHFRPCSIAIPPQLRMPFLTDFIGHLKNVKRVLTKRDQNHQETKRSEIKGYRRVLTS